MAKGINKGDKVSKKDQQPTTSKEKPTPDKKKDQVNDLRWFKAGPRISDKAGSRINHLVEGKLFDLLEGNKTVVTRATSPGIGVSTRGLVGNQAHYLPENRLKWWETYHKVIVPGVEGGLTTDAIRDVEQFPCEFSKAVGQFVIWESLAAGANANDLPDLEFSIRSSSPDYRMVVRELRVQASDELGVGGRAESHKVVVHERPANTEPNPAEKSPSTMIIFNELQRSVGISYGFVGEDDQKIPAANCRLIAYDIDGRVLATASGGMLQGSRPSRADIPSRTAYNLLGVTDEAASIAYVEFEFDQDNTNPETGETPFITAEQVIYRVWHEPFPSIAVLQGHLEIENKNGKGQSRSTASFKLPFHCNKALAVLRGYHAEFTDEPHEMRSFDVAIDIADHEVVGRAMMNADIASPWRVRLFYSIVAWNDQMVTLDSSYVTGRKQSGDRGALQLTGFHPCKPNIECSIAGALTNLNFSFPETGEIEGMNIGVGAAVDDGFDSYGSRRVRWPVDFEISPDSHRSASGYVLGSPTLTAPKVISISHLGLRAAVSDDPSANFHDISEGGILKSYKSKPRVWSQVGNDYFIILDENEKLLDFAVSSHADMAFVSIAHMSLQPEGPIRQMGAEVIGSLFDGAKMQFKIAGGIATDDQGDEEDDRHFWGIFPQVIGLSKRKPTVEINRILTQGVSYLSAVENVVSLVPNQLGALINRGSRALQITGARLIGPNANEFSLVAGTMPSGPYRQGNWFENLRQQGLTMHILDIAARGVVLREGETLLIGGACLPQGGGNRTATLVLTTNDRLHPIVQIPVSADVMESQADAIVIPENLDFGSAAVGQSRLKYCLVASIGQSPLLITDIKLTGNSAAYSFTLPNEHFEPGTPDQVEPGDIWPQDRIHLLFAPSQTGSHVAKLEITTNAGTFTVDLNGTGM